MYLQIGGRGNDKSSNDATTDNDETCNSFNYAKKKKMFSTFRTLMRKMKNA